MNTKFILIPNRLPNINVSLEEIMNDIIDKFGELNVELNEDIAGGTIAYEISKEQAEKMQEWLDIKDSCLKILFIKGDTDIIHVIGSNIIEI